MDVELLFGRLPDAWELELLEELGLVSLIKI
jgi:hypothetical protein